jgi:hypothetical protein
MLKIVRRQEANLQWLQDPNKINGENLNKVSCEYNGHFRNKKREYLNDKINVLTTNSKRGLYRGINEF